MLANRMYFSSRHSWCNKVIWHFLCMNIGSYLVNVDIYLYVQVHMQGMAVGRAVDLSRFDGYDDLLKKLGEMFDIKGELDKSAKKWQVVYTDNEDDMMMVGDDPWQ